MTGGRSTHNSGQKWQEKDIQDMNSYIHTCFLCKMRHRTQPIQCRKDSI
jgi:hypothetical protein